MVEEENTGKREQAVTQEKDIQTPAETDVPKTGTDSLVGKTEEEATGENTELDLSQAPIMPVTSAVAEDKAPASPSAAPKEIPTAILQRKARSVSHTQISSPIGSFEATVTTKDGVELHNGDSTNLDGQNAFLSEIKMKFSLLQDGNLKAGDKVRIPVTLTNNSYRYYDLILSSATASTIAGVGTLWFDASDPNNLAYVITLNSDFENLAPGTQKAISVTQKPSSQASLRATLSRKNIVLNINGMTFNFVPKPREFPKDELDFLISTLSQSNAANQINVGAMILDPNYLNNMLASNGTDPGNTGIPEGDVIMVNRVKPSGSKVISVNSPATIGTVTPSISEDGTYVVKNDPATSLNITNNPAANVTLPAGATDEDIIKALKAAGPNSRLAINNGDGTYTLAYNFGQFTGNKALTYHDIRPEDDVSTLSDQHQEIDRTDEVNEKVNKILAKTNVINGLIYMQTMYFSDASIVNSITGTTARYAVKDDNTTTQLSKWNINAATRPSNARAEGQTKITVRYVDTVGNEIASQAYQYGYPVGSTIASPSPDYDVKTKNITGYTLVKTAQPIASVAGTQLLDNTKVAFGAADKDVYFVYSVNKEKAQVRYIDDTTGATLETKELTGDYNTTDTYRTQPSIQNYQAQGYELVSDNYPSTGVTYNETVQKFEVHLKHKVTKTTESKDVKQTIRYVYEDGTKAADSKESKLTFTREVTTDAVTHQDTKGAWTATGGTSFAAVDSPVIPGFTPDQATVPAVDNVTADSSDSVVTVTYRAQSQKVVYTVIDDTTGTKLADKVALTSGSSNSTLPAAAQTQYDNIVASYTSKGYGLVSRDPLPATFDNDNKVDQEVIIHVKHETEDKQETKDVSLTVRYHGAGSQTPADKVQTAQWTRTVTLDKVTGSEVASTPWTADKVNYDAVPSPVIPGYTVDVATVPQEAVTQDNIVKDVNYTKEAPAQDQKVVYTVIDDTTGTKLADKVALTTGSSNSTLPAAAQTQYDNIIASYTSKGYGLVSHDPLPATFDNDNNIDQEVIIHVKHETEDKQETKDVSLTVRYHGAGSQTPADRVQTAQWTRTVTLDKVTGSEISATPWTADKANYEEVKTPLVQTFVADKAVVSGRAVTLDNQVEDVNYAPIGHVIPVDEDGKEIPGADHPIYPNDPTDPTKVLVTPVPEISGWTPDVKEVTPQDPTKDTPVVYRKPKPTPNPDQPKQPNTPDKPQKPGQPNKPILPKTGDKVASSALASLLGVGALFTAAGLVRGRKEEE
ncbi:mucin-binding protein [Streptococcus massiliensis]|uniref:mucin-binding protein n=1 Tax=Streptococcus massiliensis TaxID=313439 RepID=UPI00034A2504|nr:MucBP domain-containing protein [Streptococcus massiliensis]